MLSVPEFMNYFSEQLPRLDFFAISNVVKLLRLQMGWSGHSYDISTIPQVMSRCETSTSGEEKENIASNFYLNSYKRCTLKAASVDYENEVFCTSQLLDVFEVLGH
jgi:hypothetical protein